MISCRLPNTWVFNGSIHDPKITIMPFYWYDCVRSLRVYANGNVRLQELESILRWFRTIPLLGISDGIPLIFAVCEGFCSLDAVCFSGVNAKFSTDTNWRCYRQSVNSEFAFVCVLIRGGKVIMGGLAILLGLGLRPVDVYLCSCFALPLGIGRINFMLFWLWRFSHWVIGSRRIVPRYFWPFLCWADTFFIWFVSARWLSLARSYCGAVDRLSSAVGWMRRVRQQREAYFLLSHVCLRTGISAFRQVRWRFGDRVTLVDPFDEERAYDGRIMLSLL